LARVTAEYSEDSASDSRLARCAQLAKPGFLGPTPDCAEATQATRLGRPDERGSDPACSISL